MTLPVWLDRPAAAAGHGGTCGQREEAGTGVLWWRCSVHDGQKKKIFCINFVFIRDRKSYQIFFKTLRNLLQEDSFIK